MATWQLQDAKNQFGAVVNAALDGAPQTVTRHGEPAVIILSVNEYERLLDQAKPQEFTTFVDALLAIPRAPDDDAFELPPRTRDYSRADIDF